MTEKQQTAVQWLKAQLAVTHSPEIIEWLWAKAFQMEKEQIEIAFRLGYKTSWKKNYKNNN